MIYNISIHALREEGDFLRLYPNAKLLVFLSTPSVRRATAHQFLCDFWYNISIHALREEGDFFCPVVGIVLSISIHALREEGDSRLRNHMSGVVIFLSTPSVRRATWFGRCLPGLCPISIHALREEGDRRQTRG